MRENTEIWLRMESKGKPKFNVTEQVTIREAIFQIAKWLMAVYMGHRIEISIARRLEDLKPAGIRDDIDMMSDLESLIGGTPDREENESS